MQQLIEFIIYRASLQNDQGVVTLREVLDASDGDLNVLGSEESSKRSRKRGVANGKLVALWHVFLKSFLILNFPYLQRDIFSLVLFRYFPFDVSFLIIVCRPYYSPKISSLQMRLSNSSTFISVNATWLFHC